jgi:hypothetical protein
MKRLIGILDYVDAKREVRIRTRDGILTDRFLAPGVDRRAGDEIFDEDLTPYPPGNGRADAGPDVRESQTR